MSPAVRHTIAVLLLAYAPFVACTLVDEDLSDCGTDYDLDYELRLVTNMTTELQTQLSLAADITVSNAIKTYLSDVFTDYAHDVDLSFYDVEGDSLRLHHEAHVMDASQSSYTLYIPVRRYMHLALANLEANSGIALAGSERCHDARLVQQVSDTVPTHKSGIFTARLPMDIKEGQDQQFDVRLYMANCAAALVVDTLGSHIRDLKVYLDGFANDFDLCDSMYHFTRPTVVEADRLTLSEPGQICYASVNFPSREAEDTKTVIETTDPFVSEDASRSLWRIKAYATLADGKVTETILGLFKPLRPGALKVIRARAWDNGQVSPDDASVAVSVTLDWNPGLVIPIDF